MDGIEKITTVDGLKAAFPDLTRQIEDAATAAERKRIQDIEDVALAGYESIVNDAKFNNPIAAGDVAKAIVAAQKKQGGTYIKNRDDDAQKSGAGDVGAGAHEGAGDSGGDNDVDKAIDKLSQMQQADGSFCADYGDGNPVATSESIAQVITGLTALGIDPATDPRFVKSGGSALDALLRYYVDGGGFRHLPEGERDGMATEQGYYALTAYFRFRNGETALYGMTDVLDKGGDPVDAPSQVSVKKDTKLTQSEKEKSVSPLLIVGIALIVLGAGTVAALVILRKTCENEE